MGDWTRVRHAQWELMRLLVVWLRVSAQEVFLVNHCVKEGCLIRGHIGRVLLMNVSILIILKLLLLLVRGLTESSLSLLIQIIVFVNKVFFALFLDMLLYF